MERERRVINKVTKNKNKVQERNEDSSHDETGRKQRCDPAD